MIAIFGRKSNKQKKNNRNIVHDYLIACASIVIDNEQSCLLSWLGVVSNPPEDLKKSPGFKKAKDFETIQGNYWLQMIQIRKNCC
jgi:hypothetical protein